MPTNDFKPFATAPGANVKSQAQYIAAAERTAGMATGIAESALFNKVWRQSNFVTAAIMEHVTALLGTDSLDDGDLAVATARIAAAFGAGFSTGDVKPTYKAVADAGWVLMDDGTIGNGASGATTRANADTVALFTLLWNNTIDANCAVSGGRGANAAADYAANKTIALPKMKGRALAAAGTGAGLSARALAKAAGVEGHQHFVANADDAGNQAGSPSIAANNTMAKMSSASFSGVPNYGLGGTGTAATLGLTSGADGDQGSQSSMQPTGFVNVMVKL